MGQNQVERVRRSQRSRSRPSRAFFFFGLLAYLRCRQDNTHETDPRVDSYNPHVARRYPATYSDLGYPGANAQSPDREYTEARDVPRANGKRRREVSRRGATAENLRVSVQRRSKAPVTTKGNTS